MKFNKITQEQFNEIQVEAGVLLKSFNPEAESPEIDDSAIICATTGGVTANCTPSFSDYGEDIDNVPKNTLELKMVDDYDCSFAFTSLGVSETSIKLNLGAADIDPETHKITPRRYLKKEDFSDVYWVGERADGGMVAIVLKNALSTGGFSLKTNKKGKGQVATTLTGHVSIENPDEVPMEFWSTSEV